MKIKQMVAWAVVAAVVVIFLMALSPLGNFANFGVSGIAGILTTSGLIMVGVVAAVVAMYWGRK